MGTACSSLEKDQGQQVPITPSARSAGSMSQIHSVRHSFSSIKIGTGGKRTVKEGSEYGESYTIGNAISKDSKVHSVTHKLNHIEYAATSIGKKDMPITDMSLISDHLQNLANIDHHHSCRFVEAFDHKDELVLVYEKADSKSIFEEEAPLRNGKPLSQDLAQVYIRQICSALVVAHRDGIVHGRMSPASLLVDPCLHDEEDEDRSVKICDLGQFFILKPLQLLDHQIGYHAVEVLWEELQAPTSLDDFRVNCKAYESVDMWALGVLMFRMLTGKMPFHGDDPVELKTTIKSSIVAFGPEWKKMQDAKDLVQGLLKSCWRIRLSAEKVLRHPWCAVTKANMSKSKMMRVLSNVMLNTMESTFKKFVLRVIAEDMTPEQLEIVRTAFRLIDKNGDGSLDLKEVCAVLRKYNYGQEEILASEIFEAIDRDVSNNLSFAEFTAVSIGMKEYSNRLVLWHTFNRFDKEQNGIFTEKEVGRLLREVEHKTEGNALEAEADMISKDILMPMDFDAFVNQMTTAPGQPVSQMTIGWVKCCRIVFHQDVHGVMHISPKSYKPRASNALLRPVYSRVGRSSYESSGSARSERKRKKCSTWSPAAAGYTSEAAAKQADDADLE